MACRCQGYGQAPVVHSDRVLDRAITVVGGIQVGQPAEFVERRILDLLAGGLSNVAIATRLGLAPKTVANNVSSIFSKLQVRDRSEAIIRARDAGLGRG